MDQEGSTEMQPVKTRLKWFNNPKGFGFVCPEDEETLDAFLHITTLQKAGVGAVGEGASLLCLIERGPKGAQVRQVLELLDVGVLPEILPKMPPLTPQNDPNAPVILHMGGTVKWYKPDKGFGFVIPDDGMKDIFIHKTCLERHGVEGLLEGQRLEMTIRSVPKGREVLEFTILP